MSTLDYWKFIAGLGLFLFGMLKLEESLKELASRKFKLFLKKYTSNRMLAILNGAFATAILQSSSIVLLIVIAFVGAGIISLSNSLGIILGANLGTTLTGWIVSFIGFKVPLGPVIFPLIGMGTLGLIFSNRRYYMSNLFGLIIGMGLLLMGLDWMKESMGQLATMIDVQELQKLGSWAFFIFGFLVTAIIQSSSAMMTITLSALYAGVITLIPATYIIIGADLGTTITALMASLQGSAIKRRVGLAHFLFNISTAILAIIVVHPLLAFIENNLGFTDPLYLVVAFHSGFNVLGIILFFPFLGFFEGFLNQFFQTDSENICQFIHKVSPEIPEASLEAIRRELHQFTKNVFHFNNHIFRFNLNEKSPHPNGGVLFLKDFLSSDSTIHQYSILKRTEGELLEYFVSLQREKLDKDESKRLNQFILALRNGVQAAKSAKDIQHNLREFSQSVIEDEEKMSEQIQILYFPLQKRISHLWDIQEPEFLFEEFLGIETDNEKSYGRLNQWIYQLTQSPHRQGSLIATFLNVNREIYSANQFLIESLKNVLLKT